MSALQKYTQNRLRRGRTAQLGPGCYDKQLWISPCKCLQPFKFVSQRNRAITCTGGVPWRYFLWCAQRHLCNHILVLPRCWLLTIFFKRWWRLLYTPHFTLLYIDTYVTIYCCWFLALFGVTAVTPLHSVDIYSVLMSLPLLDLPTAIIIID